MDKFQILVSVFLTLLKCEVKHSAFEYTHTGFLRVRIICPGLNMQNVTYYNIEKPWKDAAHFCIENGGILESNVTNLNEQYNYLKEESGEEFNRQDVWLGKYTMLTNWTYVRGCFLINGDFQHFVVEPSNTKTLQCQMLCHSDRYKFYSLKGADCYCIENISLFVRSKDCNCVGCYKVWEHRLPEFGTTDREGRCIATESCVRGELGRSYVNCNKTHFVTCDNDAELKYDYENYQAAAAECEIRGSFIKWYSDSLCDSTEGLPIYWTSGTRHDETFLIRKAYFTENLQPEKCFVLNDDGVEEDENCNNRQFFFCRFESDEDKGDIISIPNIWIPPLKNVQSDDSGSIAAGTVTSIIVVIAVISVLVFIHRRRLSKKTPTLHESQNNSRLQDTVGFLVTTKPLRL